MKTLINGCSFSRGPKSWPYFLTSIDQNNLVNLAQAGAGNSYIHESTVSELAKNDYDLVLVMWSGIPRIDYKVSHIDYFKNSKYTSNYQHTRNDWAEKIVYPINDQDLVDKNWVFGCGHVNNEQAMQETSLFTGIYKYLEYEDFVFHFLQRVIGLQNTLIAMNISYVFSFYKNYTKDLQIYPELCKLIQWKNIYTKVNLYDMALKTNCFDSDGTHPGPTAHKQYAEQLDTFVRKNYE